jgi:hypothetical protein
VDQTDHINREDLISKALDEYSRQGNTRTETIKFRGESLSIKVVLVSPSLPLLNHDNSRLRAQLTSHPNREAVIKNPTSSEGQEVLAGLLRATEKFKELKGQLAQMGQRDPGIITRQGVLVNGNTRLVAVRDNSTAGFLVGVLPGDATSEDCRDIEIDLQLVVKTHQDYTLTNRLLLVSSLLEGGISEDEILKKMSWAGISGKKKLASSQRMQALIEEIRGLTDVPLDYGFFDGKEQMLRDLDQTFETLSHTSIRAAQEMKWTRIAAMVLGINKDQVRAISDDYMETLEKRLDDGSAGAFLKNFEKVGGQDDLDLLLDDSESLNESSIDMRAVTSAILSASLSPTGHLVDEELENFHDLKKAIKTSSESLITDEKLSQIRAQPSERLGEARIQIEEICDKLPDLFRDPQFDKSKFEFATKKILRSVQQLVEELERQSATRQP